MSVDQGQPHRLENREKCCVDTEAPSQKEAEGRKILARPPAQKGAAGRREQN